jgi:hypothetical protein
MRPILAAATLGILMAVSVSAAQEAQPAADSPDAELALRVDQLVRRLGDARAAERETAEKELLEIAGASGRQAARLLALLPEPNELMPPGVLDRLAQIRRQVEARAAKASAEGSTFTFSVNQAPLVDVLAAIEKQTGNRLVDKRQQFGGDANGPAITLNASFEAEPFWSAVDQLLDQANLSIYTYGEEDALSIVPRGPDDGPRFGWAVYQGPFRFEVLEVQTQRNLRQPARKGLRLQLEASWEPRLQPIALSQPAADLAATDDTGRPLAPAQPQAVFDVEVSRGTQAAEIILPFELPPRDVKQIASLRGKLKALVPGQRARFKFGDLAAAAGKSQRIGGVQVTVDAVRKNNMIWEIHMRLSLDEPNRALESHRGWVFQNASQLEDAAGARLEDASAGFEVTRQTPNEVGVAYLFALPEGKENLDGLTWVYETPAAIVELLIDYEIKAIDLP